MTEGQRIAAARKRKGLTQGELGEKVNLSKSAISKIENNELLDGVDLKTLKKIAKALETPDLLNHHCEACPIRYEVFTRNYPELNNIERTPMVVFSKVVQELEEAIAVLRPLIPLMMRKDFMDCPEYRETLENAMVQVFGTEQSLEILVHELIAQLIMTPEKIQEKRMELREHCTREGYHKPGKTETEG